MIKFTPDSEKAKEALDILQTLSRAGYEAYFAGGCVRDMLLGSPARDFDIATNAPPEATQKLFVKTVAVGAQFGVIRVIGREGEYEVAAFRSDRAYLDGRRPEGVVFTAKEEDVARRDFTVNGMLYDPFNEKLIDLVGGQKDLAAKLIRAIGPPEKRFNEDKLRLLRAVRFASRLGFEIEPITLEALKKMADEIVIVSSERIYEELTKILTQGNARRGFELLKESGLLKSVLPEVLAMQDVPQPPEFHPEGDVWEHTLIMLDMLESGETPELAWAVLLHDVAKPKTIVFAPDRIRFDGHDAMGAEMAKEILTRLKASNYAVDMAAELIADHLKFMNVKNMRPAKLKRFLWSDNFELHLRLHKLDCMASHGNLELYNFCLQKEAEFAPEKERIGLKPLISGYDLINMGLRPGPRFTQILETITDMRLEGTITEAEEALEWVKTNYLNGKSDDNDRT